MKPETFSRLKMAFPEELAIDVDMVLGRIESSKHDPSPDNIGPVCVAGENLLIPFRIYESELRDEEGLSKTQKLVAACLYTRHHNGFVRQKAAEIITNAQEAWVPPFVVQLVAEYVVEIIQLIGDRATNSSKELYNEFAAQNPDFCQLATQRIISYWNCYYWSRYPNLSAYPGYQVAHAMGVWCKGAAKRKLTRQGRR